MRRRLLTQIELGQANPSLVAVTRIARQLGTDFPDLLDRPPAETPIDVHTASDHVLVWSSQAGSTTHLLEATTGSRSADLWLWHLVPGDSYLGRADPARSQELFFVLAGSLTLTVDDQEVVLPAGASGGCAATAATPTAMRARKRCASSGRSHWPPNPLGSGTDRLRVAPFTAPGVGNTRT